MTYHRTCTRSAPGMNHLMASPPVFLPRNISACAQSPPACGAFLTQRGCKLLVLTQAEPDHELTALREAARARLGVDTLVVGQDAFAFVEVIKRLQAGEHVALLMDRPPAATAVTVELFGQPFAASIAAAELARATGCGIVPVIIVRAGNGYAAEVLPEVAYDRQAIGDRPGRIRLTQEILRAFEPVIRQHVAQWYHFVPIWSQTPNPGTIAPKSDRAAD